MESPVFQLFIKVPFSSQRHAEIVHDVLSVDLEPKRSKTTKEFTLEGHILKINFKSCVAKNLRVAVNSFFDHLLLSAETIEAMGPAVSESYSHY